MEYANDEFMRIAEREYCSQRCDSDRGILPAHLIQDWAGLTIAHRIHLRAFVMAGIAHAEGQS